MEKKITNFAIDRDENTMQQFKNCYTQDFVVSASLMPDAHSGYVAPIGSVIKTKKFVVPAWVGYDIGCGVIAVKLSSKSNDLLTKVKENSLEIYKIVNKILPMGLGEHNDLEKLTSKTIEEYKKILERFKSKEYDNNALNIINSKAISNLGSLGSGNHFIELGEHENELWLIIHSGSRKVGHSLAQMYMKKASKKKKGYEETHPLDIESREGKEYMNVLEFSLDYALLNRLEMAYKVHSALENYFNTKIDFELWTNKNHNHAVVENDYIIHRKGATPSKKDERGVIPGNMRDGSFLVTGLGNEEYLESSSHGAGRLLSRKAAKKEIKMDDFKKSMKGIVGTIREYTLDEAPQAYKNINKVIEAQTKSVKTIAHIRPIINWKG